MLAVRNMDQGDEMVYIYFESSLDRDAHPVCPNDRREIQEEGGVSRIVAMICK